MPTEIDTKTVEELFPYKVLSMLRREGKITNLMIETLHTFHHSGFNCHRGGKADADDKDAQERRVRYILRALLSLQKLKYIPEEGKLIYDFGRCGKQFHPLDFLAELTQHIPGHYEHRVHY